MKIAKKVILGASAVLLAGAVIMWGLHRSHETAECHEVPLSHTMIKKPMMDCTSCEMDGTMHEARHAEGEPDNELLSDATSDTEHNH